jgi:transketolase
MSIEYLKKKSLEIRKEILKTAFLCGEPAHIGGALSMVEILTVIYFKILNLNLKNPKDRFILSKGHGFLGLLSTLYIKKIISKKILNSFQQNGSEIIAHPIMNPNFGIETSNGSLGQGLSYGVGLSIANKLKKKKNNTYIILGDGECYEGSVWEAAITATENNLDNLYVFVDSNGHQNDGEIGKNMKFKDLVNKWKGFSWNVKKINGHNHTEILNSLKNTKKDTPTAIICKTIKGKGIKLMENNNDWHHGRVTKNIFENCIKDLNE